MRTLLAACLIAVLGACSLPQESGSRAFAPYGQLEARITSMTQSGPLFHVNRPAYVALFYIVPGSGVSMLYPGFGSGSIDGRVFAGSHFGSSRITNSDQYLFTSSGAMVGQPRFYFLIASDRPLNVKQFGSWGSNLHSRLGTSFLSFSAYDTMEDLAQLALPSLAADGSWTSDMYVDWPNVIGDQPDRGRVFVSCNGYEMYVPITYLMAVQELICGARDEASDEPAATEEVAKPRSRQPIPAAEGEGNGTSEAISALSPRERRAVMERISSSSQLERPVSRPVAAGGGRDEFGRTESRGRSEGPSRSSGATGSSSGAAASAPSSRPSTPSGGATASPAPSPASSGGGSGPVSAPTSRPATSSDGG